MIRQEIDPNCITDGKITFDEFSKLFCKGIFKHAIMRISNKVNNPEDEANKSLTMSKEVVAELSLDTKMNTFKRKKMLRGLDKEQETHKEVMQTLGALAQINMRDPNWKDSDGGDFADMMSGGGQKKKQDMLKMMEKKKEELHTFENSIRLIDYEKRQKYDYG